MLLNILFHVDILLRFWIIPNSWVHQSKERIISESFYIINELLFFLVFCNQLLIKG